MKKVNFILIFLTVTSVICFSQNRYGEILPLQTKCSCEMANHFRNRPNDALFRPFSMSSNCYHLTPVLTYAPAGAYLFDYWHPFAKWKKKKRAKALAAYPKKSKSNIIRF